MSRKYIGLTPVHCKLFFLWLPWPSIWKIFSFHEMLWFHFQLRTRVLIPKLQLSNTQDRTGASHHYFHHHCFRDYHKKHIFERKLSCWKCLCHFLQKRHCFQNHKSPPASGCDSPKNPSDFLSYLHVQVHCSSLNTKKGDSCQLW